MTYALESPIGLLLISRYDAGRWALLIGEDDVCGPFETPLTPTEPVAMLSTTRLSLCRRLWRIGLHKSEHIEFHYGIQQVTSVLNAGVIVKFLERVIHKLRRKLALLLFHFVHFHHLGMIVARPCGGGNKKTPR